MPRVQVWSALCGRHDVSCLMNGASNLKQLVSLPHCFMGHASAMSTKPNGKRSNDKSNKNICMSSK
jgi:hypothetical protein